MLLMDTGTSISSSSSSITSRSILRLVASNSRWFHLHSLTNNSPLGYLKSKKTYMVSRLTPSKEQFHWSSSNSLRAIKTPRRLWPVGKTIIIGLSKRIIDIWSLWWLIIKRNRLSKLSISNTPGKLVMLSTTINCQWPLNSQRKKMIYSNTTSITISICTRGRYWVIRNCVCLRWSSTWKESENKHLSGSNSKLINRC